MALYRTAITLSTSVGEVEDVTCLFRYDAEFVPADASVGQWRDEYQVSGEVVSAFIGDLELPRYMLVQMLTHAGQSGEEEMDRQEGFVREQIATALEAGELDDFDGDDARALIAAE